MKITAAPSPEDNNTRTSFWVRLLIGGLLVMSLTGFVRCQQSIANWEWLRSLGMSPGPLYLAISGGLWGSISLAAGLGLWFKKEWAYSFTRAAVTVLILTGWLEKLLFSRTEDAWTNLPFSILLSLAVLGYTMVVLAKNIAKAAS